MEMYQLRHFVRSIQLGNMALAAQDLNVSQPAVSRSIKRLELELNAKLLERMPKGVVPTEYGNSFYIHATGILNQANQAVDDIYAISQGREGQVKIGISENLQGELVERLIEMWACDHPMIELSIDQDSAPNLLAKIRSAEIGFALSSYAGIKLSEDFVDEKVLKDRLFVYAHFKHPLARKRQVSMQDLASSTWAILGLRLDGAIEFLNSHFALKGMPTPRIGLISNSIHNLRTAVLRSGMVSILPQYFVKPDLDQKRIKKLNALELELVADIGLVRSATRTQTVAETTIWDATTAIYENPEALR